MGSEYIELKTTSIYEKRVAYDICTNIMDVLSHDKMVLWSWGAEGFRCVELGRKVGVVFSVNGLLYQGPVLVLYDEGADCYRVSKADVKCGVVYASPSTLKDDVYFDELVRYIDMMVERYCDDDYRLIGED